MRTACEHFSLVLHSAHCYKPRVPTQLNLVCETSTPSTAVESAPTTPPGATAFKLIHGDCLLQMRELPAESVDVVVTSPPYNLGIKYGINPAYALAFFVHESGCGTKGVARFTKSLGNIRTTPRKQSVGDHSG